jgi:alpha-galactosidase
MLGMWFAPDSRDGFAHLERDIAVLKKAYDEWGVRFFKLDMYYVTNELEKAKMHTLLESIYALGDDVSVQMDITRNYRLNYLSAKQYGTIFAQNRYTYTANSFPHRVLRNLWSVGRFVPTSRFQFEIVNPDLNADKYAKDDPFAPSRYDMDYLFATVMTSNPLFWMELQFLPETRREELKPIMKVWREIRNDIATADVSPIGEMPCGSCFTGFKIKGRNKSYLLLFRELTDRDSFTYDVGEGFEIVSNLISNSSVNAKADGNYVTVKIDNPRAYALIEVKGI